MSLAGVESGVEVVCLGDEEFGEEVVSLAGVESGVEVVCLGDEEFGEEEVSAVGEGSVEVSLVLVQCIFGSMFQIR